MFFDSDVSKYQQQDYSTVEETEHIHNMGQKKKEKYIQK